MIKIINSPLPRPNLEFSKTLEIPFTPLATFLGVVMPAFLILTLVYYTNHSEKLFTPTENISLTPIGTFEKQPLHPEWLFGN